MRWRGKMAVSLLALALLAAGCSGGSGRSSDMALGGSQEMTASSTASNAADAAIEAPVSAAEQLEAAQAGSAAEAGDISGELPIGAAAPVSGGTEGRMLIYEANVTMEVESYRETYPEIQNLIHLSGGYLVQFSEQTSDAERSGMFTIKVPAGDFNGFMERLEKIPNVGLNRSMNAQDVSEEYVDLNARLAAKQIVESRYLKYMEQASRSEDLIRYTNELAAIQEEIERIEGRMRYLQANVEYSTIELRVYERNAARLSALGQDAGLGERMGHALRSSLNALAATAEAIMIVAAGAIPILAAVFLLGTPIYWFVRRRGVQKTEKIDP